MAVSEEIVGQADDAAPAEGRKEPIILEWTVSLARQQPEKLWTVLAAAGLAGFVGYFIAGSIALAFVGPMVILGATSDFLLPIRYRIDEKGATARWGINVVHIAWRDVRRTRFDEQGVKLSPLERPSRMEAFRGVYVRYGDRKQEVEAAVRYWSGDDDSTVG